MTVLKPVQVDRAVEGARFYWNLSALFHYCERGFESDTRQFNDGILSLRILLPSLTSSWGIKLMM